MSTYFHKEKTYKRNDQTIVLQVSSVYTTFLQRHLHFISYTRLTRNSWQKTYRLKYLKNHKIQDSYLTI